MGRIINIYAGDSMEFDSEGLGTLDPMEWTYNNKGRSGAILHIKHPYDDAGKWELIQSGRIIKADVPVRTVPEIEDGAMIETAELWMTSDLATRAQRTLYSKRVNGRKKAVIPKGTMVTVVKVGIGRTKIKDSGYGTGWIDPDALESIVATVPYDTVEDVEKATPSVQVRAQLFRLKQPTKKEKWLEVDALPVAYDGEGILTDPYSDTTVSGPDVMDAIQSGCYMPNEVELATDIGDEKVGFLKRNVNIIDALLNGDDSFIERWGGDMLLDDWSITILRHAGIDRGFHAAYGRNLTAIDSYEVDDSVVTAILPVGTAKNGDPLYLEGTPYVLSPNASEYPVPHMMELKVPEATVGNGVSATLARQRMAAAVQDQWDKGVHLPKITLRIKFAMLGDSEEYKAFKALDQCHIYDIIHVWHPKACGYVEMEVCTTTWDGMRERYTDMELGTPSNRLSTAKVNVSRLFGEISGVLLQGNIINAGHLADGSVYTTKLDNGAVTAEKVSETIFEEGTPASEALVRQITDMADMEVQAVAQLAPEGVYVSDARQQAPTKALVAPSGFYVVDAQGGVMSSLGDKRQTLGTLIVRETADGGHAFYNTAQEV